MMTLMPGNVVDKISTMDHNDYVFLAGTYTPDGNKLEIALKNQRKILDIYPDVIERCNEILGDYKPKRSGYRFDSYVYLSQYRLGFYRFSQINPNPKSPHYVHYHLMIEDMRNIIKDVPGLVHFEYPPFGTEDCLDRKNVKAKMEVLNFMSNSFRSYDFSKAYFWIEKDETKDRRKSRE